MEGDRWEVYDRYGNKIYLTAERWRHVVETRPWLEEHLAEVRETLRQGRRKQDPLNQRKYKYYWRCERLRPDFNHLVAIVVFGESANADGNRTPNNYVITCWGVFIYGRR